MNGWIKIHRRLLEWEHFKEPSVVTVYLTLLLSADRDGKTEINLGGLMNATKLGRHSVKRAIAKLVNSGEITRKKYGTKITTTIVKWSEYQMGQKSTQRNNSLGQNPTQYRVENRANISPKSDPTKYNKNVEESNKNNILVDARARMREEVMTDAMVEMGCMSLGIDRGTYYQLADQVFNDWQFQDLPDQEWNKAHFLAVMRIKVNAKRNEQRATNQQTGDPGDKLDRDAVKAMAALAESSRQPVEPTW